VERRDFLADITRAAALCAIVPGSWRVTSRPRLVDDPFTLGVASGDPTSTGGVLWTRLAPRPLEAEGGMNGQRAVVTWEVADDDGFKSIVKQGRATAAPELSYSVHVDVDGLAPDRWYFYRFSAGGATSRVGRFRTAPVAGAVTPLRFAVASCQHLEQGLFTAYEHMAREELDLVTHLGDYIYEYAGDTTRVRTHVGLEIRTIDDYRRRYAQYKSDAALQAAHARCPWLVTWDDHEVDNNYAGSIGENFMESDEQMHLRRATGYQAWWEHQPVRVPRVKSWADLNITRSMDWGQLARFYSLDARQYRSDQACDDGNKVTPCGNWADPSRTMLGEAQEKWLTSGLGASKARPSTTSMGRSRASRWINGADILPRATACSRRLRRAPPTELSSSPATSIRTGSTSCALIFAVQRVLRLPRSSSARASPPVGTVQMCRQWPPTRDAPKIRTFAGSKTGAATSRASWTTTASRRTTARCSS